MGQSERVVLKKIYVGKAALFGLYIGILMGIILAVFVFISTMLSLTIVGSQLSDLPGGEEAASDLEGASILGSIFFAFIVFITSVVSTPIAVIIGAFFYNIIAKFGPMHFEIGEYENPMQGTYG